MMNTTRGRNLRQLTAAVPQGWPHPDTLKVPQRYERKVIFDLHGPILDWIGPFCKFASELYNVEIDPSKFTIYNIAFDCSSPLTPDQFNNAFMAFARLAQGGYGSLPSMCKSIPALFQELKEHNIDAEIFTYTPGATDHDPVSLKPHGTGIARLETERLIERLGIFENVQRNIRYVSSSAKAALMAEENIPLIIEDHPVTAMDASAHGLSCIMVPMNYNKDITAPRILRLDNHKQLAAAIIDFFNKLEKAGALL